MDAQRLAEELLLLRSTYPDLDELKADAVTWIRIPNYPLKAGWFTGAEAVTRAEVVFQIPVAAGQSPYGFYVRPRIHLNGGTAPSNYTATASTPFGNDFCLFSWSPLTWVPKTDIRAGANMVNFARSFTDRLGELS